MENIEYSGYWWLPSDPDEKIAGTLTYTNDEGIKLQLIGSFLNSYTAGKIPTNIPVILGIVHKEIITLCNSINSHLRRSSPGFASQEYTSELALIGRHFTKPDELLFNKARVEYSYLSDWADLPVIREEPKLPYQDKEKELRFIYTRPETIEATTTDGKFSLNYGYSNKHFVNIEFKQFVSFIIQPNEELSLKDFKSKFIHPLNNFITFATDRTNCITELEFYSRHGHIHIVNSHYSLDEIPIKAIYKTIYPERKKTDKLLIKPEMLFSLSDIKSDFSSILQKWFDSLEKLDSIFNLFFSIRYKPDMYLENKFINLVQAAESYHRRRIQKDKKDPRLKERLEALLELIPEVTNQLINDKESFSTKIARTRNDFVHDNEIKKEDSAKSGELPWLIELLSFILQACFLTELGFTSEHCYYLFNRNDRYRNTFKIAIDPQLLLQIEQKMWQKKATQKTKNGKYATDIVAKYHSREKRILTEINREKLPSFAEALKKPGYMDLRPFYQRRSSWDKQKQSRLIESFLINIPVPPIILYEQSYNSYEVIDGQQRITAIRDFYDNQLKLTGLEFWSELNGLTYQELDSIIQRGIDRRSISTITITIITESTTDPEEAMFLKQLAFERINTGGVDLSKQEVRHCLYHGKFDELLLELSRNPIFAEAWGIPTKDNDPDLEKNNLYKKMEDAELVLRFFALRNMDYFHGGLEGFLDRYMIKSQDFDKEDIESLKEIFQETIELAHQLYEEKLFKPFDPKSNTWKLSSYQAYYDALMVGLSRHLSNSELLISQKAIVIEETKKLFQEDKLGLLTGGGKNTKADIQKRIELFDNMLLQVIGE